MAPSGNSIIAPARKNCLSPVRLKAGNISLALEFSRVKICSFSILLLILCLSGTSLVAQTPVTTWHYDNSRSSANTTETLLTPANVNTKSFGKLFTQPVDGIVSAHPLYLPGILINGHGPYNVVFVATMHDSVYAFDADNPNSGPLWVTSLLAYSPAGATSVPATVQKNGGTTGWSEIGVISTPVIDPNTGIVYLVAETYESGKVVHRLHALNVRNGQEALGGPSTIAATYTWNGVVSTFTDLYQINRPGLLLVNGHVYMAFGSNCCNDYSQGWVMSYNASTLQQEGAFDTEPGKTLASIWQKGAGISADSNDDIYVETGEGYYAIGSNFAESVIKLSQVGTTLYLTDWFTPWNYQYLSGNDQDLADGVLILPDQPGPTPHELVGLGKLGTVYLLNRDNMGQLCTSCTSTDTQILQELPSIGAESGAPVYWNNTVYFTGEGVPVMAYKLNNGLLVTPPVAQTAKMGGGGHALITANGNSNGILWFINGSPLYALNATTLSTLYTSSQAANSRDKLPPVAHFATPIAADGKVFVGTQNSLVVYGLFPQVSPTNGNQQTATVASVLPTAVTVKATDPYSGNPFPGVTVTFTDGGKGGSFNPASVVTDQNGNAVTAYKLPSKVGTYTLTATATGFGPGYFTETGVAGPVKTLVKWQGQSQSGMANTPLALPLITKATDAYGNGIAGVVITYSDLGKGGTFSANPVTTNSSGQASVNYLMPTTSGTVKINASSPGLTTVPFAETATAGPAYGIAKVSGDNQSGAPAVQLGQSLVVKVTDQYGNVVPGASVSFSDGGAGGTFSANPVPTRPIGTASVNYTMPPTAGIYHIQAIVSGVATQATFTETAQ